MTEHLNRAPQETRNGLPELGSASGQSGYIGRIPVTDVQPAVDGGRYPTKSVVGEEFTVVATVFREGHDAVNATVVVTDPHGVETHHPMTLINPGLDQWECPLSAPREGLWKFRVEGWSDPYATWRHNAEIKINAEIDVDLMRAEGVIVLDRAAAEVERSATGRRLVEEASRALADPEISAADALARATSTDLVAELDAQPLRDWVSPSADLTWLVERERALVGAWYEIFPRSEGAKQDPVTGEWQSGTFATAANRLPAIARMGFDVVYLTPIHPIGWTNRKGKNNTLTATPEDPGSPYAIGSAEGGHDSLHPDLGDFDDFDDFVAAARDNGLEVALDLALNASPDHPWLDHPEWFTARADGSIAYAENPPKKYQDIYPPNFDNDPAGMYAEVRRVIQVWLDHGIRIFRVDNPHTKPVQFWQWLIADVAEHYPETIWLAEAFTKPAMMRTLAKVGFQQSYTYYAWRNTKAELEEYLTELSSETAAYMRPSFWPTTHDILTPYMWHGGRAGWKVRAALAATLSPTYGIYAGYELMENQPRPGYEEQIDNEKYEYKDRRWEDYEPTGPKAEVSLAPYLTMINRVRSEHPALLRLRNWRAHRTEHDQILCFSKVEGEDRVIVVANLNPHQMIDTWVHLDLAELDLPEGTAQFQAHDEVTGQTWQWGADNWVRLGPDSEPVHIIAVRP